MGSACAARSASPGAAVSVRAPFVSDLLAESLLHQVALDLPEPCAREPLLDDAESGGALVGGEVLADVFHVPADGLDDVGQPLGPKDVQIREDQGQQALQGGAGPLADLRHQADFLDVGALQISFLDLLRIDVLARAEDDHFLGAPRDDQVAVRGELSQVARQEPPIPEHFGGGRSMLVIPLHHVRAPDGDLADPLGIRGDDPHLDAGKRHPDRPGHDPRQGIEGHHRRCFGQAVPFGQGEAEGQEVSGDDRVEARAAAGHDANAAAEPAMDLGEHETAQIDARRAEGARQSQEKSERRPHQGRPPSDLLEDTLVEQIEELGNGHQGGHTRLVHAGQKIRALERRPGR